MIPILAQIVQRYLPGYKIEELAADEKIKAREFSLFEKLETIDYLVSSISAAGKDLSDEWRSEVARRHEEVLRGDVDLVPFDESLRKAFARVA